MHAFPAHLAWLTLRLAGAGLLFLVLALQAVAASEDVTELLRRAEAGDSRAAFALGMRYARPGSDSQNDGEAVRWLRQAADEGLAEAQYNLGILYAGGRGVTRDLERAAHWYAQAAEQGIAGAQYNLGSAYALGEGVPRDFRNAALWFERAARQGVAEAAYNLGVLYDLGRGVEADPNTAMKWYEQAAERGYHPAASRLAALRAAHPGPLVPAGSETAAAAPPVTSSAGSEPAEAPPASAPPVAKRPIVAEQAPPARPADVGETAANPAGSRSASSWLATLDQNHYTVQVLSHTDESAVKRYLREHFDDGEAGYFAFELDGATWFSVVYGDFPSYSQATAAGESLAGRIRGLQPWVRKIAIIQQAAIR